MLNSNEIDLKNRIFDSIITWFNKQKTYSQRSLAIKLGITQTTVARWLNRTCLPDISLWPSLCEIMDISISQLLKLNDENISLTNKESQLLNSYQNDLSFKAFIDKYLSDETFKQTINSLAAYTK